MELHNPRIEKKVNLLMSNKLYFFVGIKGTGMSALALVLHGIGYNVEGSDLETYFFTQKPLEEAHIPMYTFNPDNIKPGMTIIAGNAFGDDHPEIKRAHEMGLEVIRYPDFLAQISEKFTSIAITGSHGKTSTTGLLAHVLSGVAKTSYLIGDGTGCGKPDARFFVMEACEYQRHFLAYHPDYAIITNVDYDHPDYYKDIEDVFDAFKTFATQVKKGLVVYGDDEHLKKLKAPVPIIKYGFGEDNDFVISNLAKDTSGSHFDVSLNGKHFGHFDIPSYGTHNVLNATAVIAIAHLEQLPEPEIAEELKTFKGVKRRFSEKVINGMVLIDDYAHHPAEIRATLDAARQKYPKKKIVAIFQPHTFTRTIALLDDFAKALSLADHVFLCDIFSSVREKSGHIKIGDLATKIDGAKILKLDNVSPLLEFEEDVLVFMGAGDVQKFEVAYEKILSETTRSAT